MKSYDETKTLSAWKMQNFYMLVAFLLITIELLINVIIYYYLIKY